ncbi:MAG: putative hemolysin containing domain [Alphaproteobacteria bacterium]|nr:putative hemolysin containing domain [Alphaproteobacteria bacterium]
MPNRNPSRSVSRNVEENALKKPEPTIEPAPETKPDPERGLFGWVKNLLPAKDTAHDNDSLRDAIEELIEEQTDTPQSAVAAHERRLISNILELRDLPVLDMMVPRADIVAISIDASRDELYALLAQKPHSRIPVYKGDLDNILGAVNIKDIVAHLANNTPFEIKEIMRDVLVVSPAMRVLDLLLQMRQSKVHMAFIVDEFGGIDGLITINDLVESIVGELDDEYEFDLTPQLIERPDGSAIVDGRYAITDFEKQYGETFAENEEHEEVDTMGGLVTFIAGHVPTRGEVIRHQPSGVEFEVIDADPRRVTRIRLRNLPKKAPASAS